MLWNTSKSLIKNIMEETKLKYVIGDSTLPKGTGIKYIVHVCNNLGLWGAGFVLALSKKWREPEAAYRTMSKYVLGDLQLVKVEDDTYVVNIIGQRGTITRPEGDSLLPPIRYVAIETALEKLSIEIIKLKNKGEEVSVHMPKMGSGLAGGNWKIVETIVIETLTKKGIDVIVYDLPTK